MIGSRKVSASTMPPRRTGRHGWVASSGVARPTPMRRASPALPTSPSKIGVPANATPIHLNIAGNLLAMEIPSTRGTAKSSSPTSVVTTGLPNWRSHRSTCRGKSAAAASQ